MPAVLNVLMKELLARVPSFEAACFWFDAKEGRFGPFSYVEDTLVPGSSCDGDDAAASGSWFHDSVAGRFEYVTDRLGASSKSLRQCSCEDAGSALAEVVSKHSELIANSFFPGEWRPFFAPVSITHGALYIRATPAPTDQELCVDGAGGMFLLTCEEGWTGMKLGYCWAETICNSVEVA